MAGSSEASFSAAAARGRSIEGGGRGKQSGEGKADSRQNETNTDGGRQGRLEAPSKLTTGQNKNGRAGEHCSQQKTCIEGGSKRGCGGEIRRAFQ